jgi:hypothetical protein
MSSVYPYPPSHGVRSIVVDIILTIVTCGIWSLYWQFKQMETLNAWLQRHDFSFALWLLLSLVTCGIFAIYYEYKMAQGINEIQESNSFRVSRELPLICVLLSVFGLGIASLAIQQSEINKFYDETADF